MRVRVFVLAGLATVMAASAIVIAQEGSRGAGPVAASGEWRWYSGDLGSSKYSALDQINKDNVSQLKIAWRRSGVDESIKQRKADLSVPRDFRAKSQAISERKIAGRVTLDQLTGNRDASLNSPSRHQTSFSATF